MFCLESASEPIKTSKNTAKLAILKITEKGLSLIPTSFLKDTLIQFLFFSYTSSKIIPVGLATPIIFSSPKGKIILVQLVSFRTDIGIIKQ